LPNSGLPFVSIKNDGFYLNDIKIIDKKAELQMAIFKILIDLHIEEFYTGTIKYISISKIDSLLRTQGFDLEDPEKQIRRAIYLIRTSVKLTGIGTKMDSLIESEKWKGYRISDHIFLRKF
jgi:hypothetical protein